MGLTMLRQKQLEKDKVVPFDEASQPGSDETDWADAEAVAEEEEPDFALPEATAEASLRPPPPELRHPRARPEQQLRGGAV